MPSFIPTRLAFVQQLAGAQWLEQLDPTVFTVAVGQPFPLAAVVLLAVQVHVCSLVADF